MSRKPLLLYVNVVAILVSVMACKAAITYTVGDNSGWDVSSDLDTWASNKNFQPGDALVFQYSSSDTVNEVRKESYEQCNTTNVLKTYSNGNTTVTLDRPGPWYFISGNRLYCLGGMKLAVHVDQNGTISPAGAPQPPPDTSSKTDDLPSSAGRDHSLVSSFLCIGIAMLYVLQMGGLIF